MKASKILLLSLLLNGITVSAIFYLAKSKDVPTNSSINAKAGTTQAAPENSKPRAANRREKFDPALNTPVAASDLNWRSVESPDYKKYIANLRAIGCPEETIKDIIIADVNKLYAPRITALRAPPKEFKFWQSDQQWGGMQPDKEKQKQARDLEKEKKALILELLGVDIEEESRKLYGGFDYYERTMGFIPKEKREQVRSLQEKFSEMEQDIYRKAEGFIDSDRQLELGTIAKARSSELAKILTPEELEQYELRSSNTANQMRYGLKTFEPTEEEFRSIFKLKKSFEDAIGQFGYDPDESPEIRKKRADAQNLLSEKLKTQLGEARYTEYNRSQDYSYQELDRIAKRNDLPKDTAAKIYDMKKVAEDSAQKIRSDQSLNNEQRQAALKDIQTETEKAIGSSLGEKGIKTYKRGGGYWINNLGGGPGTFSVISK